MKLNVAAKVFGKRIDGLEVAIKRGLVQAAARGVSDLVGTVIPNTLVLERNGIRKAPPVDRGLYKAGWRSAETEDGARIYHMHPKIAAIVENGVRAGNVKIGRDMIRALTKWASRKGLEVDPKKKNAESVAWAIAKNMQKYGIAPRHVLQREAQRLAVFGREEVLRSIRKHLQDTQQ